MALDKNITSIHSDSLYSSLALRKGYNCSKIKYVTSVLE